MNVRRCLALLAGLMLGVTTLSTGALNAGAASPPPPPPLTNLSHLNWLGDTVDPPDQANHTTYQLASEPTVGVLWTYAEPRNGVLTRVGGGTYHPDTNTYGQGAFNADDVSRASVVYLRHWVATGSATSRHSAYEMLRGLTYLQTSSGANAGNVVLWMQPDGTLNTVADPPETPSPSDSAESYWLARTIWALGEGYAAFSSSATAEDQAFATFLRGRMELSIAALNRELLDTYGQMKTVDGRPTPTWLIADGADASSEAVLGLAAYVKAGGSAAARTALKDLAEGIAALSAGTASSWPFGAVYPYALSLSMWHGWGAQMPGALSRAAQALGTTSYLTPAVKDAATFTPWMLTSGGPDNGRLPTRLDMSQIAYGADARVESLLAAAQATGRVGLRRLAGMQAAWFFGANAAGVAAYDPATGRTIDGISGDGKVNTNSGAESTIHGLLTMLALDANPDLAAAARVATIAQRVGSTTVQAETATTAGAAKVVVPASFWTGESLFGGTGYLALGNKARATWSVPAGDGGRLVLPVVDLVPGSTAVTTWSSGGSALGQVASGDIGPQGSSPAPGALLPVTLGSVLAADATTLGVTTTASGSDVARIDAVILEPLVSRYVLTGGGQATALLRSASDAVSHTMVSVPGTGRAAIEVYDGSGQLVSSSASSARTVPVIVAPGGFTIVRRPG
ncbi:MAG: hypothetical protein QOH80_924 [Actinomycetota bacterium]|nr:hypothetical protein [Actinomycetota bacterium]